MRHGAALHRPLWPPATGCVFTFVFRGRPTQSRYLSETERRERRGGSGTRVPFPTRVAGHAVPEHAVSAEQPGRRERRGAALMGGSPPGRSLRRRTADSPARDKNFERSEQVRWTSRPPASPTVRLRASQVKSTVYKSTESTCAPVCSVCPGGLFPPVSYRPGVITFTHTSSRFSR